MLRPRLIDPYAPVLEIEQKHSHVPLIIESHPKEYTGFPFITLIQYRKSPMLVIVDNVDSTTIKTFVLDLCGPEEIDEEALLTVAAQWHTNDKHNFPVSVAFSRGGLTMQTTRIYRVLNLEFVSRVIGPAPKYPIDDIKSIKRRRRRPIPLGVEINEYVLTDDHFYKQW